MAYQVLSNVRERESLPGRLGTERERAVAGGHLGEHGIRVDPWIQKAGTEL